MRTFCTLFTALLTAALAMPVQAQPKGSSQLQPKGHDAAAAGWQALQADDGDTAMRMFKAALEMGQGDAVLHLGLGAAAHMIAREDEALDSLATALKLDPTLVVASRLLAEVAFRRGDLALAIATYERALIYAPDNVEVASRLDRLNLEKARRAAVSQVTVAFVGQKQEEVGEHATRVLSDAYWEVAKLVGAYPADAITIELNTTRPFQSAGTPVWESDASNLLDGRISIDVDGALRDVDAFDRALTRRLVHAMIASMAPTGVPVWFVRGLAQIVTTADPSMARRRLRAAGAIPWAGLDAASLPLSSASVSEEQTHADASFLMVRALFARIGAKSTQVLDDLSDGRSLDAALAPFGFSYADLQADVVQSLEQ